MPRKTYLEKHKWMTVIISKERTTKIMVNFGFTWILKVFKTIVYSHSICTKTLTRKKNASLGTAKQPRQPFDGCKARPRDGTPAVWHHTASWWQRQTWDPLLAHIPALFFLQMLQLGPPWSSTISSHLGCIHKTPLSNKVVSIGSGRTWVLEGRSSTQRRWLVGCQAGSLRRE